MTKYVYATLSCDNLYVEYSDANESGGPHNVVREVLVKGKANVIDKNMVTPRGIMTVVTDEQAEFLRKNYAFQEHEKAGFVTIQNKKYDDIEAVAADMTGRDNSAQKTPEDFTLNNQKAPQTGKVKA